MQYLSLSADYGCVSISSEAAGPIGPERLGLPKELVGQLCVWNDRYQQVISADLRARRSEPLASLIQDLDREGLALADRIAAVIGDGSKIAYFSEGLLQRLPH
jgi:hypothetical protein